MMKIKWMALFVFMLALFCNPVCSQFDQGENEIDKNFENEVDDAFYVDNAAVDDNDDDDDDGDDDEDYENNAVDDDDGDDDDDDDDGDDKSDNKDTKDFKKWRLNCIKIYCQKDKSLCSICKVKETKRLMQRRRSYQRRRRCKYSTVFGSFCRRRSGR
ncbi:uncharacterized protein LOC130646298 [Hydractinia symbiolongicarpus]|uniref:uncharacterized protein LOC130646298 n=1 Tax=Hydractinia symbiolongicarpus TaxID=13093 RepID=UPI00254A067A|nr:uncharacterized protein LOC130646298 [Hydractinia symbiolongicarpus]